MYQLKHFCSRSKENNELNGLSDLCCHGDFFYIYDNNNRRTQILTLDFGYVNNIKSDGNSPIRFQISNTTIGVACYEATLLYYLVSKALNYKHNIAETWNINYIDSIFCTLNVLLKKI